MFLKLLIHFLQLGIQLLTLLLAHFLQLGIQLLTLLLASYLQSGFQVLQLLLCGVLIEAAKSKGECSWRDHHVVKNW